jgi:hypothetical protein
MAVSRPEMANLGNFRMPDLPHETLKTALLLLLQPRLPFITAVNCCGPLWLTGPATQERFPSPVTPEN